MSALAADNPSPDFPAIHPVLTCHLRGEGPFMLSLLNALCPAYLVSFLEATYDPHGKQSDRDLCLHRESKL